MVISLSATTPMMLISLGKRNCSPHSFVSKPRHPGWKNAPHLSHRRFMINTSTANDGVSQTSNNVAEIAVVPLVDNLLSLIDDGDDGQSLSASARKEADDILNQLEKYGQGTRPLENDLIFGNYNVAYVSQGNQQYGQPAGGRFRTGIGKILFRTTRLCQSVLRPDIVNNKVELLLLGFLPLAVGLRGKLISIPETEGGENNGDTVKVFFQPPVLSFFKNLHTRIGPPSSVVLKTTYVDERIRLGKGSRGSLFVFTRGGESENASMDQVGLEKTSALGFAVLGAFIAGLVVGGGYLVSKPGVNALLRAVGVVAVLLGGGLAAVFYRGGILEGNTYDRPEVVTA